MNNLNVRRLFHAPEHNFGLYLLLETTEGDKLTGILCGPKGKQRRAYRVRKACQVTKPRHRLRTQIAAEPLEDALYQALSEALISYASDLEQHLTEMLSEELDQADHTASRLTDLQSQRDEVRDRINTIFETYNAAQLKEGQAAVTRLQQQGSALDTQIAELKVAKSKRGFDPKLVAKQMVAQLTDLSNGWPDFPPALSKEAAAALISKAEVNLDTRQVNFELIVPTWEVTDDSKSEKRHRRERKLTIEPPPVLDDDKADARPVVDELDENAMAHKPVVPNGPLCLVGESGMRHSDEAQRKRTSTPQKSPTMLARVRCRYRRGGHGRPTSYRCRCVSPRRVPQSSRARRTYMLITKAA